MKGTLAAAFVSWLLGAGTVCAQQPADHPLIGRFEDSEIVDYQRAEFDEYIVLSEAVTERAEWGDAEKSQYGETVEGAVTRITYESPESRTSLEVIRAYEEALDANGFETIFECSNTACGGRDFNHAVVPYDLSFSENHEDQRYIAGRKPRPAEGDVHVAIYTVKAYSIGGERNNRVYTQVDVIEERPRETGVIVVEADEMAESIAADGKIALYGIYFDSGDAQLRADSRPTLEQIARLMANDPDLGLLVVGHTDNEGGFDYNIDLSRRRAESVTATLTRDYEIDPDRLTPWGVGYTAPVATNTTDAGRALNRRVELVAR